MNIVDDRILPEAHEAIADAATLAELEAAFERYGELPFRKLLQRRTSFGGGNPGSGLMFVVEEPGPSPDGSPLRGRAGHLFDLMLDAIGLTRESCYVACISAWHTPDGRELSQAELDVCLPFMRRHIEIVQPRLIVCLGGNVAKAMLDIDAIAEKIPSEDLVPGQAPDIFQLRGQAAEYDAREETIDAFVTLHPGILLREVLQKQHAWQDFLEIGRHLETGAFRPRS